MAEVLWIVKILGPTGTSFDAGTAFDTLPNHLRTVRKVDGTHSTHLGTQTAAITFGQVGLRYHFSDIDTLFRFIGRFVET